MRAAGWFSSGPSSTRSSNRHDYPEPVARLLAEAMALTVLLGTSLKFEGQFIIADPVGRTGRHAGGRFRDAALVARLCELRSRPRRRSDRGGQGHAADLLGKGVLALTVDQGRHMQRYQGIVELNGISLERPPAPISASPSNCPTEVRLSVARQIVPGDGARETLACRRADRPVPARGARAHAPAGPARRRWRRTGKSGTTPLTRRFLARGARTDRRRSRATSCSDPTVGADKAPVPPVPTNAGSASSRVRKCATTARASARPNQADPRRVSDVGDRREHREDGRIRVSCDILLDGYVF